MPTCSPDALAHLATTPSRHASSAVPRGVQMVAAIPEPLRAALETSLQKYEAYLHSFGDDEMWLKKKVEVELGGSLMTVKQRCSGMGTAWSQVWHPMPRACTHVMNISLTRLTRRLAYSIPPSSFDWLIHSLVHSRVLLLTCSFVHSFLCSLFIHSLACVFIHPCMHPCMHPLNSSSHPWKVFLSRWEILSGLAEYWRTWRLNPRLLVYSRCGSPYTELQREYRTLTFMFNRRFLTSTCDLGIRVFSSICGAWLERGVTRHYHRCERATQYTTHTTVL